MIHNFFTFKQEELFRQIEDEENSKNKDRLNNINRNSDPDVIEPFLSNEEDRDGKYIKKSLESNENIKKFLCYKLFCSWNCTSPTLLKLQVTNSENLTAVIKC